jgi:Protein of unknown function (DUF2950)
MRPYARSASKHSARLMAGFVFLVAICSLVSCGKSQTSPAPMVQTTFATPQEAGQALQTAVKSGDQNAVLKVLGSDSKPIINSGDPAEDKAAFDSFASKFDVMNRWVVMGDGHQFLYIGADNYPFPIPLSKDASSARLRFDGVAGQDEVLARRIGRNELLAIDAIKAIANAQEMYLKKAHDGNSAGQYAPLIISSPGKQDGLYWEAAAGSDESPLGRVNEFASDAVSSGAQGGAPIFDGYYFRILTGQGDSAKGGAKSYVADGKLTRGFAVVAYPAKYQDSGIMTFILSREGVVYQKDLGKTTADVASSIQVYDPTDDWTEAE